MVPVIGVTHLIYIVQVACEGTLCFAVAAQFMGTSPCYGKKKVVMCFYLSARINRWSGLGEIIYRLMLNFSFLPEGLMSLLESFQMILAYLTILQFSLLVYNDIGD